MSTRAQARVATVAKVMAAASRVFGEYGYRKATIPLIADAAGVSVGSFLARRLVGPDRIGRRVLRARQRR